MYTAQVIIVIRGIIKGGIGQHSSEIDNKEVVVGFQTWYVGEVIYALLSCFIKTSVVLYLHRAFFGKRDGPDISIPALKHVLNGCLVLVWVTSVSFLFTSIFQCSPPSHYWEQFEDPDSLGSCSKTAVPALGIAVSAVLAIGDWALALVPSIVLWKMKLPLRTRIALQALLSLGWV